MTDAAKADFEALHLTIAKRACELLKKRGAIKNVAIVGKDNDLCIAPLVDAYGGQDIYRDVSLICRSIGADFVFLISEAWCSSDVNSSRRPSEDPNRREVLIITSEHAVFGQGVIQYEMIRKPNGKLDKLKLDGMKYDDFSGRLSHLLTGRDATGESVNVRKQPGYQSHFKIPGYTIH